MPLPYIAYSAIIVLAGLAGLCFRPGSTGGRCLPPAIISAASLTTLVYLLCTFGQTGSAATLSIAHSQLPFGGISAGTDPLSAFFLIPLLVLAASCSLYGISYFKNHPPKRSHWFFFGLLVAGMVMVLLARNIMLFILAWETMSLSSFFLVITDNHKPQTNRAGWIYFITAHIGTAFLLTLFFFLASSSGSFEFNDWARIGITGRAADIAVMLALVAFGLKAGFIPFHVWLPLAHPSAPSHVSALMSGIMIKMGIYGILRILTLVGPFHGWWGSLLIALGAISGILGVLFAIGQHDMKRLLAYHSVENIGIILLGLGLGIVGTTSGSPVIALFGFAGALLHVLNHALFKGLLFLGAGAVIRQAETGEIDRLGGLVKTMPKTALLFLTGSVAICGLPFLNGFISELMIYSGGIISATEVPKPALAIIGLAVIVVLALIGGLACACFAKVFGVVFLGEPRDTSVIPREGEAPAPMWIAMAFIAVLCVFVGLASPLVLPYLAGPAGGLAGVVTEPATRALSSLATTTTAVLLPFAAIVIGAATLVFFVRRTNRKPAASAPTWDCGYGRPQASMQYTASSFAAPIVGYFRIVLAARGKVSSDNKPFPGNIWSFHSTVTDWFLDGAYAPAIRFFDTLFSSLRWFQSGKTGQYVLYIATTICCLIIWKFFL